MRFNRFDGDWENTKLKSILKIKSGQDQKKVIVDDGKYNIYGTGGVIGKSNEYLYDKESVGIGRKGTIDRPFYFNEPFWTVDTLFYSEIFNANPKFVYYLFQTINWYLYNQSTGVPSLTSSVIENISKYLPKYSEQEKIAKFFCILDEKIETQKKIISSLESQIKAIKCNLFNSTIGTKKALTDVLDEISIKSTINNQYPVVSSTVKGLVLQSEYFDKEIASADNTGYKIIARDNIIISPQNLWMGNITFNDKFDNGIVSPSYKIFNVKDDYNKLYIFELMTTNKAFYLYKTVSEQGASVVRRNLNTEAFMQLIFNVPSRETQDKIINNLYCFKNKLENEKKILSLCEKQKQYLLDKLFI